MDFFELDYVSSNRQTFCASDEVGRGPLAGPVVACTVSISNLAEALLVLHETCVTDSKKLTQKKRNQLIDDFEISLIEGSKIELGGPLKGLGWFSIIEIQPEEIDQINILQASLKAMSVSQKISSTERPAGVWLIDGNKLPRELPVGWKVEAIVKGDSKSSLIGLASIIAKTYRDNLMIDLGQKYPGYGLEKHAGYPTKFHKEAISKLGPTPIHRKSFKGVREFL